VYTSAKYAMALCMCTSVTSQSSVETVERIEVVFRMEASFAYIVHCIVREFMYLQNKGTSFCHCPKLWAWKISLWQIDRVVNKKSFTVKLVDLTYNRHT